MEATDCAAGTTELLTGVSSNLMLNFRSYCLDGLFVLRPLLAEFVRIIYIKMSEEETSSLKYGDRIILRCSTESKYYYLLMRGEQCVMEAHLQINNPRSFNMYDYH